MDQVAQDWRFDRASGLAVNDKSKTAWVDGVGWVRADGWAYDNGKSFRVEALPAKQQSAAKDAMKRVVGLFGHGQGSGQNPLDALNEAKPVPDGFGPSSSTTKPAPKPALPAGSLSAALNPAPGAASSPAAPASPATPSFADFNKALGLA